MTRNGKGRSASKKKKDATVPIIHVFSETITSTERKMRQALGKRIRQLRVNKGWSEGVFAEQCGLTRDYMAQIERGEEVITFTMLIDLARQLETTASKLLEGIA